MGVSLPVGKTSRDTGTLSAPKREVSDATETQKGACARGWAMLAMTLELRERDNVALTLEFGPEGSVRGFQADKMGRAFQAEATGCVGAGAGRDIVSEKHMSGRGQLEMGPGHRGLTIRPRNSTVSL